MPRVDHWRADQYGRDAGFVSALGEPLLSLLGDIRGWRVLDLGCGDGRLTARLRDQGASVVGVDASADMVRSARDRGIEAFRVDGHDLDFDSEFDAVFSNAAIHWMRRDPDRVLRNVHRSLKPGGLFVAELGGQGNIAAVERAISAECAARGIDPERVPRRFYPGTADYARRLEAVGFRIEMLQAFDRPTPLPGAFEDWLRIFAQEQAALLPASDRDAFFSSIALRAAPALFKREERASEGSKAHGHWVLDYVRLRLCARRPEQLT